MKIYPSNMNHLRFTKPTNQEIQEQYFFPCSITVLNQSLQTAELFYYDGEGNEFPQGRLDIPSDYLFQKALIKTDTAPTTKGLYPLSETGVYTNLGGINAQSGKLNFASFDGTTWSLIAVDMPITNYNTGELLPTSINKAETGKSIDNYLFNNSENLANPNNFKYGYYISHGDGLEYTVADFSILSNQVLPNKTYYIKKTGDAYALAYYDISGNFISGIATYGASFTTPPNAYLVKINVRIDQISTFMLSEEDVPFSPYFKNFKFQNKNYSENLYKKSMIVAFDSYVSYGDGNIYPLAHYYVAKIPVQAGKTYTIINHAEPSQSALMSPDNIFVQGFMRIPNKITIPSGVGYILITLVGMQDYNFFGFYEGEVDGVKNAKNTLLSNDIKVLNSYYTVDKHSGDFKTISEAVSNLNDGATILINGMFEESVNLLSRKLHLVGVNKFTCGIVTNDGDYNKPPVNMSAGSTLKNLTIIADNGSPNFTTPAYAIHHDWDNGGGESIIDDCILISKFHASIGIGTHNNQQVTIRNSKLYNLNPSQPYDMGGILFHNKQGSGATRQMLTLENCVIESLDSSAIRIVDSNNSPGGAFDDARDTLIRLTNNVFYSHKYGVGAGVIGGDIALDGSSKWGYIKLHSVNFGNNISELNP